MSQINLWCKENIRNLFADKSGTRFPLLLKAIARGVNNKVVLITLAQLSTLCKTLLISNEIFVFVNGGKTF